VKIGPAVPWRDMLADRQTDRYTQTDRRVDHNTPHLYRGKVTIKVYKMRIGAKI